MRGFDALCAEHADQIIRESFGLGMSVFMRSLKMIKVYGVLAQLGARHTGSVEVTGSNPVCSTKQS